MFIGLMKNGREPSPSAGYSRVEGELGQRLAFPTSRGYGEVNQVAVFENAQGGEPLEVVELEATVDCHEGVIPLWWEGKLLRGMDVTASVLLKSGAKANA